MLLLVAVADSPAGVVWGLRLYEAVLGMVISPAVIVAAGLLARRVSDRPQRLTGPG
jgi:hypothetical protein